MKKHSAMIKIAIASLNPTINDWSGQLNLIRKALDKARTQNAKLLVLPELSIGTPDAGDLYQWPQSALFAEQALSELAPLTLGLTVICGAPFRYENHLYNVAAVFHDGMLRGIVPKRYGERVTAEERWFSRWDYSKPLQQHLGAMIGAWVSDIPELENLQICVGDIVHYPDLVPGCLCVVLNNRPFVMNQYRTELKQHLALSEALGATIVRTNLLGSDDGTHVYDGGGFILNKGHIVALSPRFSFEDVVLITSEDKPAESFDPTLAHFEVSGSNPKSETDYPFAELELALCLALHDYLRRAHISRLCLALSGGRDSAMIAILAARLMAIRYPDESPEKLKDRMKDFLFCAYLPNISSSSDNTQKAALALAEHFGFSCPVIPINDMVAPNIAAIEQILGRKLTWEQDDLTLQNVQARARSTIIWTLANACDALLLTTGNLSESAVGYSTMDGDSSGCLDPIGNIPKTLVSAWLEWARNFHDIPELDLVFAQPPSAELRPIETDQQDEKDLMPYVVLDTYIDWFIVRKLSPKEVFSLAKQHLAEFYHNDDEIRRDIKKFVSRCTHSQWKRVRYANSFKVMHYDIAPDSDLQWPCLQDAFPKALDEL